MHGPRLGKGEGLADTTSHSLAQRQIEPLYGVGQSTTFGTCNMLLGRNDGKVRLVKVGVNQKVSIGLRQPLPELAAGFSASVTDDHGKHLTALKGNGNPYPGLLAFSADE